MVMSKEELERIEELKQNEDLFYKTINYLIELWDINETSEEIIEHFKQIGFKDEDLERLGIKDLY